MGEELYVLDFAIFVNCIFSLLANYEFDCVFPETSGLIVCLSRFAYRFKCYCIFPMDPVDNDHALLQEMVC